MDKHNCLLLARRGSWSVGSCFYDRRFLRPCGLGAERDELKINQMKTQSIKEAISRLEAMRDGKWTKEQDAKTWSELPKGRETESLYYRHLKTEIEARASEGAI